MDVDRFFMYLKLLKMIFIEHSSTNGENKVSTYFGRADF